MSSPGILFSANEPACVTIRGMAQNKSFGDGFKNQVAFEAMSLLKLDVSDDNGIDGGYLADMSPARLESVRSVDGMI